MNSVLIVDDEAPIRELLSRWLEGAGYTIRQADSAEAALAMMATSSANVVMCDIEMPGQGGVWLADQLCEHYPQSAMVLATALDTVPPVTSLKPGIVDYLLKPFERARVLSAVAAGLAWHTSAVERARQSDPVRNSMSTWLDASTDTDD